MIVESDEMPIFLMPSKGEFRINIEHTARSWGSDIESMLTNQIKSLLKVENRFKSFVRRHSNKFCLGFAVLFFLTSILGAFKVTNNFINTEIEKVKTFTNIDKHNVDEKIDFLTSYIASGSASQHYFKVGIFLLVSIILSIFFGVWIEETASNNREPSFVILTRKAKEYRDEITEKMKKKWTRFFISLFSSILTGIISNYIFKWIVE